MSAFGEAGRAAAVAVNALTLGEQCDDLDIDHDEITYVIDHLLPQCVAQAAEQGAGDDPGVIPLTFLLLGIHIGKRLADHGYDERDGHA